MMHRFGLGTETDYKKAVVLFRQPTEDFRTVSTILESCTKMARGVMKNLEVITTGLRSQGNKMKSNPGTESRNTNGFRKC